MTRYKVIEIAGELEPVEFELLDGEVVTAVGDPTQAVWDSLEAFSKLPDDAGSNEASEAVRGLFLAAFGEEQTEKIMASNVGLISRASIAGTLAEDYSEKAGKVQGSNRASRRSTVRSKPTSNGSTASTSKPRVGADTKKESAARG